MILLEISQSESQTFKILMQLKIKKIILSSGVFSVKLEEKYKTSFFALFFVSRHFINFWSHLPMICTKSAVVFHMLRDD